MKAVVLDEGPEIKQYRVESVDKCKQLCIKISNCNSFKYCQTQGGNGKDYCHLKDKTLYGNEKLQFNQALCETYYKSGDVVSSISREDWVNTWNLKIGAVSDNWPQQFQKRNIDRLISNMGH